MFILPGLTLYVISIHFFNGTVSGFSSKDVMAATLRLLYSVSRPGTVSQPLEQKHTIHFSVAGIMLVKPLEKHMYDLEITLFNSSFFSGTFVTSQNLVRSFSVSSQREGFSKYHCKHKQCFLMALCCCF